MLFDNAKTFTFPSKSYNHTILKFISCCFLLFLQKKNYNIHIVHTKIQYGFNLEVLNIVLTLIVPQHDPKVSQQRLNGVATYFASRDHFVHLEATLDLAFMSPPTSPLVSGDACDLAGCTEERPEITEFLETSNA